MWLCFVTTQNRRSHQNCLEGIKLPLLLGGNPLDLALELKLNITLQTLPKVIAENASPSAEDQNAVNKIVEQGESWNVLLERLQLAKQLGDTLVEVTIE